MQKSALILGATGLVGSELVSLLANDEHYGQILCLGRRALDTWTRLPKVTFVEAQLSDLRKHQMCFNVDEVFVCLGTTIKSAGSQSAFRAVDYDSVYLAAELAAEQQVRSFVWVSSVGANSRSHNFYLRVKGELEEAILSIETLNAAPVNPSLLLGERSDMRIAERLGGILLPIFSPLMVGRLRQYRPIDAKDVAREMITTHQQLLCQHG